MKPYPFHPLTRFALALSEFLVSRVRSIFTEEMPIKEAIEINFTIKNDAAQMFNTFEQSKADTPGEPAFARSIAETLQGVIDTLWADPMRVAPPMQKPVIHGSAEEFRSVPLLFRRLITGTVYDYAIGYCNEVIDTTEERVLYRNFTLPIRDRGWQYIPLFPFHWVDWDGAKPHTGD